MNEWMNQIVWVDGGWVDTHTPTSSLQTLTVPFVFTPNEADREVDGVALFVWRWVGGWMGG